MSLTAQHPSDMILLVGVKHRIPLQAVHDQWHIRIFPGQVLQLLPGLKPLFLLLLLFLLLNLVLVRALVKQLLVHLHEELESVVDEAVNGLVPVGLAVLVQGGEHDRQNHSSVVVDQRHDVFIVPVVERTLCNLGRKTERKTRIIERE